MVTVHTFVHSGPPWAVSVEVAVTPVSIAATSGITWSRVSTSHPSYISSVMLISSRARSMTQVLSSAAVSHG